MNHKSSIYQNQNRLNYDWYLIYKTRNNLSPDNPSNPIDCFLCANKALKIANESTISSKTYTYADFNEGVYYYFNDLDNNNCIVNGHTIGSKVTVVTNITYTNNVPSYTTSSRTLRGIVLYRTNNKLYYAYQFDNYIAYWNNSPGVSNVVLSTIGPATLDAVYPDVPAPEVSNLPGKPMRTISSITITKGNFFRYSSNYYSIPEQAYINATQIMAAYIGQTAVYTDTYANIDKTDSRIVKIIKLPYAPCNITYSSGIYVFPSEWTYINGYMKLNDASLSTEFLNERIGRVNVPELYIREPNICSVTDPKDIKYESKLYHSDFYDFKLVYDSFVRDIKLENFETDMFDTSYVWKPNLTTIDIDFKPTNTINSKFAFRLETYLSDPSGNYDFASYNTTSDYEKYLLVSRNNEETIFSNDYLNYIRTGYNYDKKSKQEQSAKSWLLGGLQLAAGVASFAASAYTGGVSAAAGIALVSGAISTFASNAYTQASNERSMQSKLTSLAAQSSNVAGSDDVDLLSFYNENRLQIIKYRTEELQEQALYNLFFYCGYKRDQMKIPDTDSRYWFNFVQCKPVFTEEGVTPYNDYIADVKSRYESGVTIYHHHPNVGTQ